MLEDSRNNNKELKEKVEDSFQKANLVAMNESEIQFRASNIAQLIPQILGEG